MPENKFPEVLYHYTNQHGLIGILTEKELWATQIQYMNDASEFIKPVKIADKVLGRLEEEIKNGDFSVSKKFNFNSMKKRIHEAEQAIIYIVSFSKARDLLSQWRAYGAPDSGYCIGFNTDKLRQSIPEALFELRQCEYYSVEGYEENVLTFFQDLIAKERQLEGAGQEAIYATRRFFLKASTMKFDYFEKEYEWRFISTSKIGGQSGAFNVRPGKSTLIPYCSIKFDLSSIVEIIVGPTLYQELAKAAVLALLRKSDVNPNNVSVSNSGIPYRSF